MGRSTNIQILKENDKIKIYRYQTKYGWKQAWAHVMDTYKIIATRIIEVQ